MTDLVIPDYLPVLSYGAHDNAAEGGCLMECVSFFYDGGWDDRPECVHDLLAGIGIKINDAVSDKVRPMLVPTIPMLLNTQTLYDNTARSGESLEYGWTLIENYVYKFFDDKRASCWCCYTSINPGSPEVEKQIDKYLRCGIDKLQGRLWQDYDWRYDDIRKDDYTTYPVEDDASAPLAEFYVGFVRAFRDVFGGPVDPTAPEFTPVEWTRLAEHMTPA